MPELAEVEWYRKQWDAGVGKKIVALRLHAQKRIFRGTSPPALQRNLVGEKLLRSSTRGKRMLFEFSRDSWLGLHLGMTGKIHLAPANFRPNKHDHLVLYQRERALVFTDSRQFGRVRFHHGPTSPDWWSDDVPEISSPRFNRKFVEHFLNRHGKAPIKAVVLLQNGFSGIGNWMADEILWRAQIHPVTPAGKLTARQRDAFFRGTKFVARESLRTLGQGNSDPPSKWLIHQKWKRKGVCPRDGTLLRRASIGGRTTAWCPKCQR
jgi:formamidopyrimidine-DNA glycosylase